MRLGKTASGVHEKALRSFAREALRGEAEREADKLLEEAVERAAAEKAAAEKSGLGGMAAGLVRRMGDVFTFGKATTLGLGLA